MLHRRIAIVALVTLTATALFARQDAIDRPTIERIRQEGLERSKVMEFYSRFVTVDGPRLTGSPAHKAAAEWARQQFAAMGLQGAQLEPFEFGRGWELTRLTIEMVAPRYMPLVGYAEGWSAPTAGVIEASPVFIGDQTADQVEALKGTLKGAIVLTQPIRLGSCARTAPSRRRATAPCASVRLRCRPPAARRRINGASPKSCATPALARSSARTPASRDDVRPGPRRRRSGAAVDRSCGGALQHGRPHARGGAAGQVARRDWRAVSRRRSQHLQRSCRDPRFRSASKMRSCSSGAISTHGIVPRSNGQRRRRRGGARSRPHSVRSVRVPAARSVRALERRRAGALGSKAYATRYLEGPANARARENFNVYFKFDPGTGPVYGWYLQGQPEVAPLFDAWLAPFQDIGARRNVTEHRQHGSSQFHGARLPGFNPIQDYADYDVRTHHTNMDTFERVGEKDMAQSAVISASFAWHAAMRDEMIPRPRPAATR